MKLKCIGSCSKITIGSYSLSFEKVMDCYEITLKHSCNHSDYWLFVDNINRVRYDWFETMLDGIMYHIMKKDGETVWNSFKNNRETTIIIEINNMIDRFFEGGIKI